MQSVLRLVPHDRLRAVDDVGGHLLPAMGRQAVHKQGIVGGFCHQLAGYLVRGQHVVERRRFRHVHGDPGIRADQIGASNGFLRILGYRPANIVVRSVSSDFVRRVKLRRSGHAQREIEF